MSLGAWLIGRKRDERGMVEREMPSGKYDWKAAQINATIRKRAAGRFRRQHGEATFELAVPLPAKRGRPSPYATRKLWVSRDPTSSKWRVTRVDAKGPAGHTEYASWTDAVVGSLVDYPGAHLGLVTQVRDSSVGRAPRGLIG